MNKQEDVLRLEKSIPDELWPYILEVEYLTDSAHLLTNHQSLAFIPGTGQRFRREAMIDVYHRFKLHSHVFKHIESYLKELVSSQKPLQNEDASLIITIYELLWADGDLQKDVDGKWLVLLQGLGDLDNNLGNPIKYLRWRIVRQSSILKGYSRWQLASSWRESPHDSFLSLDLPQGLERLSQGWENWFHLPIPKNDTLSLTRSCFTDAVRSLGLSSPFHYSAVEGTFLLNRIGLQSERIGYWDEEIARKSNDVALIVSNRLNGVVSEVGFRSKKGRVADLYDLYRQQMLIERLALRYWQIDSLVSTIAVFSRLIIDQVTEGLEELKVGAETPNHDIEATGNDDAADVSEHKFEPAEFLTRLLTIALHSSSWGWPYQHVSRKAISHDWPKIESLLAQSCSRELILRELDKLTLNLTESPAPVLYRNPFLTCLDDLLTEKHLDVVNRFTDIVFRDRVFMGDPTDDILKFWTRWVSVTNPDSPIIPSAAAVLKQLIGGLRENDIRDCEDLIDILIRVGPVEIVNELSSDLIMCLHRMLLVKTDDKDAFVVLYRSIVQGVNNRTDLMGLSTEIIEELRTIAADAEPFLKSRAGLKYAINLIGGHAPTVEEDKVYLGDILTHVRAIVDATSQVNRSSWGMGFKHFPFTRPIQHIALPHQIEAVAVEIERLANAKEPTSDEIEGIFLSIGQFLRGAVISDRTSLVHSIATYASAKKSCRDHSVPFETFERWPLDGSLLALAAVKDLSHKLTTDQLNAIIISLKQRPDVLIIDFARYCAPVLAAAAVGSEQVGALWAQQMIMNMLFRWDNFNDRNRYGWLRGLLSGIRVDGEKSNLEFLISVIHAWYQASKSKLDTVQVSILAYHIGRLYADFPTNQHLINLTKNLSFDSRSSVRRNFESGMRLSKPSK